MFSLFRKSNRHRGESAMGAAVLGGLMAIAAIPALFSNEGRAVQTARALAEGAAAVVSIDATQLDQRNEESLVHLSGLAMTEETLTDERFGVKANAIRLIRTAEMFQWKEIEQKVTRRVDGKSKTETEYEYEKDWDSKLHSSSAFREPEGHQNPAALRFESKVIDANEVSVGQFRLPRDLVGKIKDEEAIDVDLSAVPDGLAENLTADGGTETNAAGFYWSSQPGTTEPQIGDVRIRYSTVRPTDVSVIAQQSGTLLRSFKTHHGREISIIRAGNITADEMFEDAQSQNATLTWALRFAGAIVLIVGIGFVMRPLTTITGGIPIVGNLIGTGAALVAIMLGGAVAILTISSAWLIYRPLIAMPMFVVGIAMLVMLVKLSRKQPHVHESVGDLQNV